MGEEDNSVEPPPDAPPKVPNGGEDGRREDGVETNELDDRPIEENVALS